MSKKYVGILVKIILIICFARVWTYYVDHVNDDEITKMRAEIPAITSMEGTETLAEKMEMLSRYKGNYFGRCDIYENGSEKEITDYYKREFEKYGWKYIGRFNWNEVHTSRNRKEVNSNENERHYYFEKDGIYCMYLCLKQTKLEIGDKHRVRFSIRVKKDYDDRQYCKIEDE